MFVFFFFKQKTAYEMRISDWSSDVCSSDLRPAAVGDGDERLHRNLLRRRLSRGHAASGADPYRERFTPPCRRHPLGPPGRAGRRGGGRGGGDRKSVV